MWWESNYQRAELASLPDPAICTFGCWNRLVLSKGWPRLLYSTLYLDTWKCRYFPSSSFVSSVRVCFRFTVEFRHTWKHMIQYFYMVLLYICSTRSPLSGGVIKLRWSLLSCSTWPQLLSGWKLKIQMLTYSRILSKYEKGIVGVVWNFTAKVEKCFAATQHKHLFLWNPSFHAGQHSTNIFTFNDCFFNLNISVIVSMLEGGAVFWYLFGWLLSFVFFNGFCVYWS